MNQHCPKKSLFLGVTTHNQGNLKRKLKPSNISLENIPKALKDMGVVSRKRFHSEALYFIDEPDSPIITPLKLRGDAPKLELPPLDPSHFKTIHDTDEEDEDVDSVEEIEFISNHLIGSVTNKSDDSNESFTTEDSHQVVNNQISKIRKLSMSSAVLKDRGTESNRPLRKNSILEFLNQQKSKAVVKQ